MAKSYLDKDGLLYFLQKIRPSATPSMDGTASTGTSKRFAAEDHVHPRDTSLAPKASPAFTGTPTAPTAATGTATTQVATTEFVANTVGAMTSGVADVQIDNTSIVTSGIAKIPTASSSAKGLMTSTLYDKLNGLDDFTGALPSSGAGTHGLVPAPPSGGSYRILLGYGTWATPSYKDASGNTVATAALGDSGATVTYTLKNATSSAAGLLPSTDKTKLDSITMTNGKIDASVLPSYVDDVIEAYPRSGQTELSQNWLSLTSGGSALTPETGKIYILMADSTSYATNTQFRWSGTAYVKMLDGGVTSITNAEIDTIVAA